MGCEEGAGRVAIVASTELCRARAVVGWRRHGGGQPPACDGAAAISPKQDVRSPLSPVGMARRDSEHRLRASSPPQRLALGPRAEVGWPVFPPLPFARGLSWGPSPDESTRKNLKNLYGPLSTAKRACATSVFGAAVAFGARRDVRHSGRSTRQAPPPSCSPSLCYNQLPIPQHRFLLRSWPQHPCGFPNLRRRRAPPAGGTVPRAVLRGPEPPSRERRHRPERLATWPPPHNRTRDPAKRPGARSVAAGV